ncbi:hypothetical protein BTHE68_39600 [Burkholderia sp. THE68]|nr:hypothetical protein BTHE68_39600 [Burkholderia sp. THE68]
MTRLVTFKKLWLASERDKRGRELSFGQKTLLLGPNHTGKSRICKSLYWSLGCEPQSLVSGNWDPATVGLLEFSFAEETYFALRKGRAMGLFSSQKRLLFATDRNSEWVERTAKLFGFHLKLPRPGGAAYGQAGLDYMSLPFYVDQDGSWGADWTTYDNLGQFSRWKEPVFATLTGSRPSAYLIAKQKKEEIDRRFRTKEADLAAQKEAFLRVRESLPKATPSLDISAFRAELVELAKSAQAAQAEQMKARERLIVVTGERQSLESKLKLATAAQHDLGGDFEYLSAVPDDTKIECPTCGVLHTTSFHARLSLGQDLEEMNELVAQLSDNLDACKLKESELRQTLRNIERHVEKYEQALSSGRSRTRLDEVLSAHSKRTLDEAFSKVESTLGTEVAALRKEQAAADVAVKRYDDKHRKADVSKFYSAELRRLSDLLNIPTSERIEDTGIGKRPKAGGSSGRRAILAVHLALVACNFEKGDLPLLPVIIDTLQQSGQDDPNLGRMFNIAADHIGERQQLFIAMERLPAEAIVDGFDVQTFETQQGLLRSDQFNKVALTIRPMLGAVRERIQQQASTKHES